MGSAGQDGCMEYMAFELGESSLGTRGQGPAWNLQPLPLAARLGSAQYPVSTASLWLWIGSLCS